MHRQARVLVVEDEMLTADYLQEVLVMSGYEVTSIVHTGELAVKSTTQDPPDLVLMDIKLEGHMDGIEAASIIQMNQHIPVIYLTSHREKELIDRAKATDPYGYLLKPVDQKGLYAAIEIALGKRKLENHLHGTQREHEQAYQTLAENLTGMVYRVFIREHNRMQFFNEMVSAMTGYKPEELKRGRVCSLDPFILPEDHAHVVATVQQAIRAHKPFEVEYRFQHKNGSINVFSERGRPVYAEDGKPLYIDGVIFDITDRRQTEEQLESALKKTTALLQEVHHRTRNNMQVIRSLLYLQTQHVSDEFIVHLLEDIDRRIQSMSLVHQKLHHENLTTIDLPDYIEELTWTLLDNHHVNPGKIAFVNDIEPVDMTIDTAVSFGLLLNEVLSNALKHAFPGDREGEIHLRLRCIETGGRELQVSDNGVGLPEDFERKGANSLGIQLIHIFVQQLQGSVQFQRRQPGTGVLIRFKEPYYEQRI